MSRFVMNSLAGITFDEPVEKHMAGQHDQSAHGGRRSVVGVPSNIDLDGKRFSEAERKELGSRATNLENTKTLRKAQIERELLGADYSNLPAYGTDENRIPIPEKLKGTGVDDGSGFMQASQFTARDPAFEALVNSDSEVLAAKADLEDHFLYREAANLESTKGGTMKDAYPEGDWYSPTNKLTHFSKFPAEREDESGFERSLMRQSQEDAMLFPDPNFGVAVGGTNLTKQQAQDKANEDWQTFMQESEPQIIMSATAVQRVATAERVKTVHEVGRPARAGTSDDAYVDSRRVYENAAFGYGGDTPPELRPVSGLLGAGEPYSEYLDIYGGKNPAVIRLKPEVKERTTYTLDDSLNGYEAPAPVINPRPRTMSYSTAEAGVYGTATGNNWYADHKSSAPEIQIHGGVTLDDIAGVTFYGSPSASVIATMERKGIPYTVETPTGRGGFPND